MLREEEGYAAASLPALLRLARSMARSMDRLAWRALRRASSCPTGSATLFPDLAGHWQENTRLFARIQARWRSNSPRGELDRPSGATACSTMPPAAGAPRRRRMPSSPPG
jgi:ATP-dependent helicase/nuclease subunit B